MSWTDRIHLGTRKEAEDIINCPATEGDPDLIEDAAINYPIDAYYSGGSAYILKSREYENKEQEDDDDKGSKVPV